jgi:hypothetical protein
MSEGKFDSHRRLCPDGACIGVIGDDGRCRVCGRAASGGDAPAGFVTSGADADDGESEDGDSVVEVDGPGDGKHAVPAKAAGFDPNRRLCPDGSCLGVLGPDGVCNVCGQKAD